MGVFILEELCYVIDVCKDFINIMFEDFEEKNKFVNKLV